MADWTKSLAGEQSLVPVSKLGYENNLALVSDSADEEASERILERNDDGSLESGAKIRREARKELDQQQQMSSPRRPSSLYREDSSVPGSQKIKNIFANEKIGNGEAKNNHHVQFNRQLIKDVNDEDEEEDDEDDEKKPSRASPSISTSSSSSDDNSSLDQLSEARPPDGGWGWVVVAAAFMVNLIADGITFSFGVIYHEFLTYFGEGKATTSWIGSLFMAMPLLSGPIASFLTDRYGCRKVTIAGSILATTGFVISYFANSMGMLILTFGVLAGFGLSLCFVAAVVIVAYYFDKRRSFATGLSVCGSGIGTFIFPPLIQMLIDEYTWRGTTLILAGLFLNLAVCGCLMRDLEWTTTRAKVKTEERRRNREKKRFRLQSSSADSFSASSSANTAQTVHGDPKRTSANAMIIEGLRLQEEQDGDKLFSSLVSLPTFVKNGEKVPLEVLELLSTRKNVYNVLLQNYPNLLISSRSFSDSSGLNDQFNSPSARFVPTISPLAVTALETGEAGPQQQEQQRRDSHQHHHHQPGEDSSHNWLRKVNHPDGQLRRSSASEHSRRLPTAYLKDIRVHRHSLTYRGAMLNINRYRLRASSCPDIYRNSMTTIAKQKMVWYSGLWEFWDLLVDMLDFSHFADSKFLLFSISNFLLHTWYDVPYMYLTDNAIQQGFSEADASLLISVIGIMNMAGEILLGWAGDRAWVNPSLVYAICMALCGAFTALIPMAIQSYYLLSSIAGAFGFFIAANYSLTSIILVEAIGLERFTNAYGLLLLVQGIANLMGPPLAGWLCDVRGNYNLSFYLAGLFIAISGVVLMVMPLMDTYRRWKKSAEEERANAVSRDFAQINNV
ncbi:uncharacterized protein LOC100123202 isoform X1 [Nasonia vitripennis]|uniref:Major facilitator superfamily (MFS) profile domain-containing protein n=1 Tax=Nasonia vitripennis TaxID=7425 RepID=A0A7M7ISS7_NASVI|nr:uncharacterized protein LOC100123202 isoform X1 [Nasonia vitripennis]XP_016839883.1 uncharacterized protein LOC100123202 isoform X1 [Nasonia vitripennis]